MAPLEQLEAYLVASSYLGSELCATLEDYRQCKEISAGSIDATKMPAVARWHSHVSYLMAKYPVCDWRGDPVPAGKAPAFLGGAASAASAAPAQAAPAKDAKPKKEAAAKKEAAPKAESKKADKKKGGKEEEAPAAAEPTPEDLEKQRKDKKKKVIKEGGKRGVEIEGAADMGGLQFFCTAVEEPDGDLELTVESMKAMNKVCDPGEEERKGCSGHIGKMIFSAGAEQLAVVAYVPEDKQAELSCEEWLKAVLGLFQGEVLDVAADICTGKVAADSDKGVFPLKIREPMILEANNFLRKKGLFPEDDDDDDDYVFGDDDFPS